MSSRVRDISRRQALLGLLGSAAAPHAVRLQGQDQTPAKGTVDARVPAQVRKIIVDQLRVDEAKVRWESRFVEDLGADSLDTVELVMELEETFKIQIPDEDAEAIKRVRELVEYLRKRKAIK